MHFMYILYYSNVNRIIILKVEDILDIYFLQLKIEFNKCYVILESILRNKWNIFQNQPNKYKNLIFCISLGLTQISKFNFCICNDFNNLIRQVDFQHSSHKHDKRKYF